MIRVIRTDGTELLLNADLIGRVEMGPPTTLILVDGQTIPVKNIPVDIQVKVYSRRFGMEEENEIYEELEENEVERPEPS